MTLEQLMTLYPLLPESWLKRRLNKLDPTNLQPGEHFRLAVEEWFRHLGLFDEAQMQGIVEDLVVGLNEPKHPNQSVTVIDHRYVVVNDTAALVYDTKESKWLTDMAEASKVKGECITFFGMLSLPFFQSLMLRVEAAKQPKDSHAQRST